MQRLLAAPGTAATVLLQCRCIQEAHVRSVVQLYSQHVAPAEVQALLRLILSLDAASPRSQNKGPGHGQHLQQPQAESAGANVLPTQQQSEQDFGLHKLPQLDVASGKPQQVMEPQHGQAATDQGR